jgi:hypothetical protein
MSLNFVREVWDALRSHMDSSDRSDAADSLINLLIDNNYEADEIKEVFRGDKEVLSALLGYIKDQETEEEIEEWNDESDTDDWD